MTEESIIGMFTRAGIDVKGQSAQLVSCTIALIALEISNFAKYLEQESQGFISADAAIEAYKTHLAQPETCDYPECNCAIDKDKCCLRGLPEPSA